MPTWNRDFIEAAIAGFEAQKQSIDEKISGLRQMLTGAPATAAAAPKTGKSKRKFSAEAIERMRAAQQRRWAKARGESGEPATAAAKSAKPKRKISAAGRKAIAEAQRKRWAARNAA